ncbi:protein RoBo-1-like [Mastomys coucha]|uniref:protein RoBo-1-like n=1 Tax=Mastomys coucha TaxID=35658 RepID=UPI001261BE5C|nr:protein RoBo-1-like [Mastomys coucha]
MGWSSVLKSLLTVFVFSILAVCSVESYNCTKQLCQGGPCLWDGQTCVTSVGCFNQIQKLETPSSSTNQEIVQKGCAENAKSCDLEFSATLGNQQKFRYKNQCCYTEKCNKDNINLSPSSSEVNGVECLSCYNEKNKTCPTTTIKCTGAEKKCVEVTGTDPTSTLVLYGKGCATENTCALDMIVLNSVKIKTSCIPATNGSPSLKSIASLPVVLFLLKILL